MSIRPNDCYGIVAFFLYLWRIHLWVYLLLFNQVSSWKLINASRTFAEFSQCQGSNFLLFAFSFDDHFPLPSVVVCIYFFYWFFDFLDHVVAKLSVKFFQVMLFREDECERYSQIRIFRNFWKERQLNWVLYYDKQIPKFQIVPSSFWYSPFRISHP